MAKVGWELPTCIDLITFVPSVTSMSLRMRMSSQNSTYPESRKESRDRSMVGGLAPFIDRVTLKIICIKSLECSQFGHRLECAKAN